MRLKDSIKLHQERWWPRKDQSRKMVKLSKLLRDLIFVAMYLFWVLVSLNLFQWEEPKCNKNSPKCRKKGTKLNMEDLFVSEVGIDNFVYFLPLLTSCCWKSYVILSSKKSVDEEILALEELIDLQCKSEIFIAVYFLIEGTSQCLSNLFMDVAWKVDDSIRWWACVGLVSLYLGLKYHWSLGMRLSFWKAHLLMDSIFKRLGDRVRALYHSLAYRTLCRFAYKPAKQKYIRKYGLYFDLM